MKQLIKDLKEAVYIGYNRFVFLRAQANFRETTQSSTTFSGVRYDVKDETNSAVYLNELDIKDIQKDILDSYSQDRYSLKRVYSEDGKLTNIK